MSNGNYNREREAWLKEHCTEITSQKALSPRGYWFAYASLYNGYIYAIGDEQGNYAGGDLVSLEYDSEEELQQFILNMADKNDPYMQSLYSKIKDTPIATKEMYDEMNKTLEKWK